MEAVSYHCQPLHGSCTLSDGHEGRHDATPANVRALRRHRREKLFELWVRAAFGTTDHAEYMLHGMNPATRESYIDGLEGVVSWARKTRKTKPAKGKRRGR